MSEETIMCDRNCDWCVHRVKEGCELGKGDTNE